MKSDMPIDYAVFQLSPKQTRCELFVSSKGNTEKLASGLVKPFVTHLKFVEEDVGQAAHSIKLEVEGQRKHEGWFTKGTLERFVRFVSTPEVLEMVNTLDVEMSQLEAARKIYSQGAGDQFSGALAGDGIGIIAGADATKKELLRAMDVRLAAVRQDLTAACARASAAGFNPDTVTELQLFADCFGAHRLNDSCTKFISLCQRRPEMISPWKPHIEDEVVRSSWGSDMSIDDLTEEPTGSHTARANQLPSQNKVQHHQAGQEQQNLEKAQRCLTQSRPEQTNSLVSVNQKQNSEEEAKKDGVTASSQNHPSQPGRRLSVQDRINLFENKQKENSGGKPVVVGRSAELRRLSSDASSASGPEKAVLRRWSGASDMSIDLGNDRKDSIFTDSPALTPSSGSLSQNRSGVIFGSSDDLKDQKGLNDTSSSYKNEAKKDQTELLTRSGFGVKDEEVGCKVNISWKDQAALQTQVKFLTGKGERVLEDHLVGEKGNSGREEKTIGVTGLVGSEGKSRGFQEKLENITFKNQASLQSQIGSSVYRVGEAELGNRVEGIDLKDQPRNKFRVSHSHSQSLSGQFEVGIGVRVKELSQPKAEGMQPNSQLEWGLPTGESDLVGKKDFTLPEKEAKEEDLEIPKMKVQKPFFASPEQIRKMQSRDECGRILDEAVLPSKKASEIQESFGAAQASSMETSQRVRQSKGNQELNDELKMKANELEKLFAEHKLRIPGDQSASTRKLAASSQYPKPAVVGMPLAQIEEKKPIIEPIENPNNMSELRTPEMKMVNNQGYDITPDQNIAQISLSDDSRGKLYERYMQKRDAKLREEWSTKRVEKEAKLKAMQDSLERNRSEMKARLFASANKQNTTRRQADSLRKSNVHSTLKKEQQPVDLTQSEEDENSEFSEQKYYGQDKSFSEASFVDDSSKNSNKRPFTSRSIPSSTPRTTVVPVQRSSSKISNSNTGRRRMQLENPLVQSVPNFSDLRKENTKPSSGVSKMANRTQLRTYTRSRSTNEDIHLTKEEKPRRSQSLRKSVAVTGECKDISFLNADSVILAPLKFDDDRGEQGFHEKFAKPMEPRPFLRKGDGRGPRGGASADKLKASVASHIFVHEDQSKESLYEVGDSNHARQRGEEEEEEGRLESPELEDCAKLDNGKASLSQESDKMIMSGSENGDSLRSLSHIDPSPVAELPASVPSSFYAVGSFQDSPGESPVSWNSRMHPFSYQLETSDIDAAVDSPIGSPASWNSHPLNRAEADAARMRKKWGSAQKPILLTNSSHNQSRKDVTKGFKRLLKFGRKSRGTDNLVDWISATTSEGDDDTEDGRDPASRSSEDLRKSRMGFSQSHPSDDSFNESELFNEHVQILRSSIPAPPANFKLRDDQIFGSSIKAPRSFFSLSTFRSKGSDSKPR
ncbi:hypothetical protein K2173_009320 [Erythroxylum novogranatense]|uniref:COP1-interacting protein 7 n=1 Tax=Erythroxylum novogranatense TaxID=1862640 RepID=A0AAV8U6T1_9ROSI|nr:hypothetical protein K2173_009320 [Erythroxylum novogranatense]